MPDQCEHRECQRRLDEVYHDVEDKEDGLKVQFKESKKCVNDMKKDRLPRWAQIILTSLLLGCISSAIVVWADVQSLPDKYVKKDHYTKHCEKIAVLEKDNENIKLQLQKIEKQNQHNTEKILQAIQVVKKDGDS